jgi:hypothetical protein
LYLDLNVQWTYDLIKFHVLFWLWNGSQRKNYMSMMNHPLSKAFEHMWWTPHSVCILPISLPHTSLGLGLQALDKHEYLKGVPIPDFLQGTKIILRKKTSCLKRKSVPRMHCTNNLIINGETKLWILLMQLFHCIKIMQLVRIVSFTYHKKHTTHTFNFITHKLECF